MAPTPAPRIKISYSTLRNDNKELHARYEAGVEQARAGLGAHHQNYIDGRWVDGSGGTFEARSPIDRDWLVGTFAQGGPAELGRDIPPARKALPRCRNIPERDRR